MLKTSGSTESTARPRKDGVGDVGNGGGDSIDDGATHLDAQDKLINGLIN